MRPALRGFIEPADEAHEAVRDLVRARDAAFEAQKQARQQLHSFLLRHGRYYTGRKAWTRAHGRWLASQAFEHPAHQILLAEYCQAVEDAGVRLDRLGKLIGETPASWSMAPAVAAYQAMRGVAFNSRYVGGRNRRYPSLRQCPSVDGISRTRSFRKLNRRARQARRDHQGGQRSGTPRTDRGGLDIPLSSEDQPRPERCEGLAGDGLYRHAERLSRPVADGAGDVEAIR